MKKHYTLHLASIITLILLSCSFGFTQDVNLAIESSLSMEGALDPITDVVVGQYLPSYGYQINSFYTGQDWDDESIPAKLKGIVTGLSLMFEGLAEDDWVSVGMTRKAFGGDRIAYLARVKPNDPETFEMYINGEKQ